MDLLAKINAEIKTYCKANNTSFKVLTQDDVVKFCISVVKQRVYNKDNNKLGRMLLKELKQQSPNKFEALVKKYS